MPTCPPVQSDDSPSYERVDPWFKRYYSASYAKVYKLIGMNVRNREVASQLYDTFDSRISREDEAISLEECHSVLVGNDPNTLKSEYYCGKYLLCGHCAEVRSSQHAAQVMKACERFGQKVKANSLRIHKILIKPDAEYFSDKEEERLEAAVIMLRVFREDLSKYHLERNSAKFLERLRKPNQPLSARDLKLVTWGPAINTLHVVPLWKQNRDSTHAHMHLSIVTCSRTSKKKVLEIVQELWCKSMTKIGFESSYADVTRLTHNGSTSLEARMRSDCVFSPFVRNTDDSDTKLYRRAASIHFSYISRPLKPAWDSAAVLQHDALLRTLRLTFRDMRQFLGHEGVVCANMPHAFPVDKLHQQYAAHFNYDDSNARPSHTWSFYELDTSAGDASSVDGERK